MRVARGHQRPGRQQRALPLLAKQDDAPGCIGQVRAGVLLQGATGDADGYGLLARRFASPTDTSGTEIALNTTTAGDQRAPAAATLANGNVVVVWESADAGGKGVFGQLFNASGAKIGADDSSHSAASTLRLLTSTIR